MKNKKNKEKYHINPEKKGIFSIKANNIINRIKNKVNEILENGGSIYDIIEYEINVEDLVKFYSDLFLNKGIEDSFGIIEKNDVLIEGLVYSFLYTPYKGYFDLLNKIFVSFGETGLKIFLKKFKNLILNTKDKSPFYFSDLVDESRDLEGIKRDYDLFKKILIDAILRENDSELIELLDEFLTTKIGFINYSIFEENELETYFLDYGLQNYFEIIIILLENLWDYKEKVSYIERIKQKILDIKNFFLSSIINEGYSEFYINDFFEENDLENTKISLLEKNGIQIEKENIKNLIFDLVFLYWLWGEYVSWKEGLGYDMYGILSIKEFDKNSEEKIDNNLFVLDNGYIGILVKYDFFSGIWERKVNEKLAMSISLTTENAKINTLKKQINVFCIGLINEKLLRLSFVNNLPYISPFGRQKLKEYINNLSTDKNLKDKILKIFNEISFQTLYKFKKANITYGDIYSKFSDFIALVREIFNGNPEVKPDLKKVKLLIKELLIKTLWFYIEGKYFFKVKSEIIYKKNKYEEFLRRYLFTYFYFNRILLDKLYLPENKSFQNLYKFVKNDLKFHFLDKMTERKILFILKILKNNEKLINKFIKQSIYKIYFENNPQKAWDYIQFIHKIFDFTIELVSKSNF